MLFDRSYHLTLSIIINLLLLRPSFCVAEPVLDPHSFSMLFSHLPRCLFSRSLANELNLNTATQVSICLRAAQTNKLAVAQNKCERMHMNEMSATNLSSRQANLQSLWSALGLVCGMGVEKHASCLQWGGWLNVIDLQDYIMEGFPWKLLHFYLKGQKEQRVKEPDMQADEKGRLKS